VPYASKRDRSPSSVAPKLRFPTNIFFNESSFCNLQSNELGSGPGRLLPDYARSLISRLSNYIYIIARNASFHKWPVRKKARASPAHHYFHRDTQQINVRRDRFCI
jgi:hypothetical protein